MSSEKKAPLQSFRKHLLRTYIFISIQFTVTIIIGISALISISYLTREHLNQIGPLVTTVNRLLQGVSDSMLSLDEWVLTGVEENQKKREQVWQSTIYPAAEQLYVQLGNTEETGNTLLQNIQHLQAEQWVIEDLAHTQGNEQALNLYLLHINDIEQKVFSVITHIINVVSSEHGKHSPEAYFFLLSHSANIRGFFSLSSTNLLQFILTGAEKNEKDFRKNFSTSQKNLKQIKEFPNLPPEAIDLLSTLNTLFVRYTYQTNKAIQQRYSPQWNLAIYNYTNILEPLQKKITTELNQLLENRTKLLHKSSNRLIRFGHLVILLSTLVGASTASLLILRAHRDIRLAGELEKNIQQYTDQLEELSRTDQLTGLYNRRAMMSLLNQELTSITYTKAPLSFVYFDIDKFKQINDQQGHIIGDQILRKVADALRASIRSTDFPCRYGGDEFCIILPGCTDVTAQEISEQLITVFRKKAPGVSLSIGITEVDPAQPVDSEELIKQADHKMYLGKKKTGFQVHS
jgi:diguanylate cyclase (GGDEF)-like protein